MAAARGQHYTWENSRRRHHCRRQCHYLCCHDRPDLCCHHHSKFPIIVIIIAQIFCLSDPANGEMAQLFSSDPSDNKEMMLGGLPLGQDKVTSSLYISIPRMNCIHQSLENQHWQVWKKYPWFYWCDYQQTHLHNFRSQTPDKLRFVFNSIHPSILSGWKPGEGVFLYRKHHRRPYTLYPSAI